MCGSSCSCTSMAVWGLLLSSWELQDQADLRGSNSKNSCFCVCRRWGELMFLISTNFISHSLSWLKFFVRKPIMQHICLSHISIFVLLSFFWKSDISIFYICELSLISQSSPMTGETFWRLSLCRCIEKKDKQIAWSGRKWWTRN